MTEEGRFFGLFKPKPPSQEPALVTPVPSKEEEAKPELKTETVTKAKRRSPVARLNERIRILNDRIKKEREVMAKKTEKNRQRIAVYRAKLKDLKDKKAEIKRKKAKKVKK